MKDDFLITVGRRISEVRRSRGMTQNELADRLGVSTKHISHTECGTSSLSIRNLVAFCELFSCSLDYILCGAPRNDAISRLPEEIINLLYTGTDAEIERLNRYLHMYTELTEGKKPV